MGGGSNIFPGYISLQYLLLVLYNNKSHFYDWGCLGRGPPTPNHKNGPWFYFPPVLIISVYIMCKSRLSCSLESLARLSTLL